MVGLRTVWRVPDPLVPTQYLQSSKADRSRWWPLSATFDGPPNICWRASSRMRFADDADAAVRPIAWLHADRDVDILAEGSQQAHQALAGEIREASVEESRHLRLIDAHERRRRDLGQTLTLDHLPDVARKLSLDQLFLGFCQPHIGEHVAAARCHQNARFSLFSHCSQSSLASLSRRSIKA